MKFFAKLSVVLLILGGILFAIGNAMGGTVYSAWYDGRLHPWHEARNIGFFGFPGGHTIDAIRYTIQDEMFDILDDVPFDILDEIHDEILDAVPEISPVPAVPAPPPAPQALPDSNMQNNGSAFWSNNIKNLEFDLGCGSYTIQPGTEFSISGTGLEEIKTWSDADTWHVSYSSPYDRDCAAANRAVTITVPEGMAFHDIELNAGAASVALCALTADKIEFSVGAGTLSTAPLTANTLSAEVGMGNASIQLADYWQNYHYTAETGVGSVRVNGETLSGGLAGESSGGTGRRELDFTVGMGDVQITTRQD